ncbi:MAG: fibronectin type III domain-containing protein [Caldisericia bacterium]
MIANLKNKSNIVLRKIEIISENGETIYSKNYFQPIKSISNIISSKKELIKKIGIKHPTEKEINLANKYLLKAKKIIIPLSSNNLNNKTLREKYIIDAYNLLEYKIDENNIDKENLEKIIDNILFDYIQIDLKEINSEICPIDFENLEIKISFEYIEDIFNKNQQNKTNYPLIIKQPITSFLFNSLPAEFGWYPGDGHLHSGSPPFLVDPDPWPPNINYPEKSGYSDGFWTVEERTNLAKSKGLKWLIITDHGNYPADKGVFNSWYYYKTACSNVKDNNIIVLPGEEIATDMDSHYLAYNINYPMIDKYTDAQNVIDFVNGKTSHNDNGFGIIAHPFGSGPFNGNYHWIVWDVFGYSGIELISGKDLANENAIGIWDLTLHVNMNETINSTNHNFIVGLSNSDDHFYPLGKFGKNMSYIYTGSNNLPTEDEVYESIKKGRVIASSDGSFVSLTITYNINNYKPGDYLEVQRDDTINILISAKKAINSANKVNIKIYSNLGKPLFSFDNLPLDSFGNKTQSLNFTVSQNCYFWVRCDFLKDNNIVANVIANPIFIKVIEQNLLPPPSNLILNVISQSQIDLSWQNLATGVTKFEIERSLNESTWTKIDEVPGNIRTYSDTNLQPGTKYFYRVRSYRQTDNQYSQYSEAKSATTLGCKKPTLSKPLNNSTNISLTSRLSWGFIQEASNYNLKISTSNNFSTTIINKNITQTYYDIPPNTLQPNTKYYWKISYNSSCGLIESDIWNFTTLQNIIPSINLIYPQGGETFSGDQQITITWTSQNLTRGKLYLYYSIDNFKNIYYIDELPLSSTSYTWRLPNVNSINGYIIVSNFDGTELISFDFNDNPFSINKILNPQINLIYPQGGETFNGGEEIEIRWDSQNLTRGNIGLFYTLDDFQTLDVINVLPSNSTSYIWNIPNVQTDKFHILVTNIDGTDQIELITFDYNENPINIGIVYDKWIQINHGLYGGIIKCLAIDPSNPNTIYAGTVGGVFKSTNGGLNWSPINTGLTSLWVFSLAIDP